MDAVYVLLTDKEREALSRQVKEWLSQPGFSMFEGEREEAQALLQKLEDAARKVRDIPVPEGNEDSRSFERMLPDDVRPLTKRLVNNLLLDRPLSVPEVADFGVETDHHYRALQNLVRECASEDVYAELDQAYGNGKKLTVLVKKHVPQYAHVEFKTALDFLHEL